MADVFQKLSPSIQQDKLKKFKEQNNYDLINKKLRSRNQQRSESITKHLQLHDLSIYNPYWKIFHWHYSYFLHQICVLVHINYLDTIVTHVI